jgi:hypothetical protein
MSNKIRFTVRPWDFKYNCVKDKRIITLKTIAWTEYWLTLTKEGYKTIKYNVDMLMSELGKAESALSSRIMELPHIQALRLKMERAKNYGDQASKMSNMAIEMYKDPQNWVDKRTLQLHSIVKYANDTDLVPMENSFNDPAGNAKNILQRKKDEQVDVGWLMKQLT